MEEAQGFRESLGPAIRIGDEERGTAQLTRQIGCEQSLRDIMQTAERNMMGAAAQCRQRTLHRRVAEQDLQSFANRRKYHARTIRIRRLRRTLLGGFSQEWRWSSSLERQE